MNLYVLNLSEPSYVTRGLIAIVKAETLLDAWNKVKDVDNDIPCKTISRFSFEDLGDIVVFDYKIYEYWE